MNPKLKKLLTIVEKDIGPNQAKTWLRFATDQKERFEIIQSKDTGEILFAIIPSSVPDFWMDSFKTKKEALALCHSMGWKLLK